MKKVEITKEMAQELGIIPKPGYPKVKWIWDLNTKNAEANRRVNESHKNILVDFYGMNPKTHTLMVDEEILLKHYSNRPPKTDN